MPTLELPTTIAPLHYAGSAAEMTAENALGHLCCLGAIRHSTNPGSFIDQTALRLLLNLPTTDALRDLFIVETDWVRIRPQVGMGATALGWTDRTPFHVIHVTNERQIRVRSATATELPWEPIILAGGFVAHWANQHDQKWEITPGTDDRHDLDLIWNKWKGWQYKTQQFTAGRACKFHDYNF